MNLLDEVEKLRNEAVSDFLEIRKRADRVLTSSTYKKQLERSRKNWLDLSVEEVMDKNRKFIYSIGI